ncbi:MAG: hypothetical protein RSB05_04560 [Clostridiales bacterium]
MKATIWTMICILIASLFLFTACGKNSNANKDTKNKNTTSMENPVVATDSEAGFATLGLTITAPKGGENVEYSVIDKTVAQIKFDLNGAPYTFRGAETTEDISGIYEEFEDEIIKFEVAVPGATPTTQVTVKTTVNQGKLATWQWSQAKYSLYTPNKIEDETMKAITTELAISTCQTVE